MGALSFLSAVANADELRRGRRRRTLDTALRRDSSRCRRRRSPRHALLPGTRSSPRAPLTHILQGSRARAGFFRGPCLHVEMRGVSAAITSAALVRRGISHVSSHASKPPLRSPRRPRSGHEIPAEPHRRDTFSDARSNSKRPLGLSACIQMLDAYILRTEPDG